jgi:hypothetical protein
MATIPTAMTIISTSLDLPDFLLVVIGAGAWVGTGDEFEAGWLLMFGCGVFIYILSILSIKG